MKYCILILAVLLTGCSADDYLVRDDNKMTVEKAEKLTGEYYKYTITDNGVGWTYITTKKLQVGDIVTVEKATGYKEESE